MAKEFKAVIGDPKTGRSYSTIVSDQHATALLGKRIGDELDGIFFGIPGYKVRITGGTDFSGFPMRRDLQGPQKKRILVSKGLGFKPKIKGQRKKKTFRGNTISADITQINVVITQYGQKPVEEYLGKKEKE